MSSEINKYAALVEGLYAQTISGKIEWVASMRGAYNAKFDDVSIRISEGGEFNADIVIEIYNGRGESVDKFSDVDLADIVPDVDPFDNYYALMSALFYKAKRHATGADRIIDSILGHLGFESGDVPVKKPKKKETENDDDEIPF